MTRTVTAMYDSFTAAQRAVQDLVDAGFNRDDISLIANDAAGEYKSYTTEGDVKGEPLAVRRRSSSRSRRRRSDW